MAPTARRDGHLRLFSDLRYYAGSAAIRRKRGDLLRGGAAEVVHYYRTAGVTLDLGGRFGPHWVFGTFDRREPEWCAAALKFTEAAAY